MIRQFYSQFGIKAVMTAIMCFFVLCFASYSYLIYTSVGVQHQLGATLNQAGMQRMLTQKLLSQVLIDNFDEVSADKQQLLEIHSKLVAYVSEHDTMFNGYPKVRLNQLYYSEPHFLIKRAAYFLETVSRASNGEDISTERLFSEAARLTKLYNDEVTIYQDVYEQEITKTLRYSIIVTGLVVCVAVILLFFVLLPFSQRLTDTENQLKYSANIDPLTGLLNRRAFYTKAESIIRICRRQKQRIYVLSLDIDHFKRINDTYGHGVGDHILRHFSNTLTDSMRSSDLAARFGGEEFIVLLPNSQDEEATINVGEKICNAIKDNPFVFENADIIYTVSIGIGEIYDFDLEVDNAIKRSDNALYHAKQNGRNQVVTWRERVSLVDTETAIKCAKKV